MTSEHRHYARIDDDGAEGAGAGEGAKGVEAAVGRAEEEAGAGAEEDDSNWPDWSILIHNRVLQIFFFAFVNMLLLVMAMAMRQLLLLGEAAISVM